MAIDANNRHLYATGTYENGSTKYETFITPELRAIYASYADPLTLNFKLMIDYSKPYGLFAPEENIDSALAYLKRIGEVGSKDAAGKGMTVGRYEMLKQWIEVFKIFVKNYDFLILSCEGMDEIVTHKPHEKFTTETKFSLTIRETSDMFVQSLITQWRHIWYDDIRMVEVLPANLRRFDINILVYSAGYYNMAVYDLLMVDGYMEEDTVEANIFPTLKKLSDQYFVDNAIKYKFNNHLITLKDANINNEDSGKSFFSTLSNEPGGEMVKNIMTFNFRFATYKGTFINIFGDYDFTQLLAVAAATDRITNTIEDDKKTRLQKYGDEFKAGVADGLTSIKNSLSRKPMKYLKTLLAPMSPIGNAIKQMSKGDYVTTLIKAQYDKAFQIAEDKLINANVAKLNNLVTQNFSNTFLDAYQNYFKEDATAMMEQYSKNFEQEENINFAPGVVNEVQNMDFVQFDENNKIYSDVSQTLEKNKSEDFVQEKHYNALEVKDDVVLNDNIDYQNYNINDENSTKNVKISPLTKNSIFNRGTF